MKIHRWFVLAFFCGGLLLSAGCSFSISSPNATAAPTEPGFITATLPPTPTPRPTSTPVPPSITPTVAPVTGVTSAQVNVRSGPGTNEPVLGRIEMNTTIQIVGKDPAAAWYLIQYDSVPAGTGWVAAQFVRVSGDVNVPVIGASPTPTLDATNAPQGPSGILQQKLNVRSGPGTSFNALGLLNANETVTLTGKNETGTWLQIVYPAGPGGRGWVSAGFVQVSDDLSGLPVLDEFGTPIVEQSPTPGPSPTPTVIPAAEDLDSPSSPAAQVVFAVGDTSLFTFSSDVSAPQGDNEDWIAIKSNLNAGLIFSLTCTGNDDLKVELWQSNTVVTDWGKLNCGDSATKLNIIDGQTYLLRLTPSNPNGGLQYVAYTLTIKVAQ